MEWKTGNVSEMAIRPIFGSFACDVTRNTRSLLGTPLVHYLLKMLKFGLTTPTPVWTHGLVNKCRIGLLCDASWLSPQRPCMMRQPHMLTHPRSPNHLWIQTLRLIHPQWLVHIHRCHRFPTQRHHVLVPLHVSIPVLHLPRLLQCVHRPQCPSIRA